MIDGPDYAKIGQGERAARLLEDDAFHEAVKRVRNDIVDGWEVAETVGERERAHAKVEVLGDIVRALSAVAGDGEMEKLKIEDE